MRKRMMAVLLMMVLLLAGCGNASPDESAAAEAVPVNQETETAEVDTTETEMENTMRLFIGETEAPVNWEENASVDALKELCPLTIQMSMYGGFEQVGPIGTAIPSEDTQTTTAAGDIVLYNSNQIVVFYGSNSWAYTRLGHIDLTQEEMRDLLANGDVSITLE